jgi:CRP/FNR family transcriptional regulator
MAYPLSGAAMARFADAVKKSGTWQREQHLFHIGDELQSIFLLRSGSVKVYTIDAEGAEHVLGFYLPGDVVGLDAITSGVHDCAAIAIETCNVCVVAIGQLQQLNGTLPGLEQTLSTLYAREIARGHAIIRLLSKRNAEQRLAGFLLHLSQRFAELGYSAQEFNLSMSRHEIGNHLGLALETVSRLFTRLCRDGVVQIKRRRVVVQNPQMLESLAGETAAPQLRRYYH